MLRELAVDMKAEVSPRTTTQPNLKLKLKLEFVTQRRSDFGFRFVCTGPGGRIFRRIKMRPLPFVILFLHVCDWLVGHRQNFRTALPCQEYDFGFDELAFRFRMGQKVRVHKGTGHTHTTPSQFRGTDQPSIDDKSPQYLNCTLLCLFIARRMISTCGGARKLRAVHTRSTRLHSLTSEGTTPSRAQTAIIP